MEPPRTTVNDLTELREVVEHLAAIHRPSASAGEREAAEWIAGRLRDLGCTVEVEKELAHGGYWWPIGLLSAAGALAGGASLLGARLVGAIVGLLAAWGIRDDIDSGHHLLRHALLPYRPTWNVLAETGDVDAERTLVILAHHDAAHSGLVFHPGPARMLHARFPAYVEGAREGVPFWFPVFGGPLLVALGSLLRLKTLVRIGAVLSAGSAAAMVDIGLREVVPGANDNLSAVAVQLRVAAALRDRPVSGLRVLLLSAGSEESLQEGILAFARRHFDELPPDQTWFLNLDTVGSPILYLVEGEGVLQMRQYDPAFKELIAGAAVEAGVPLRRGVRARASTDTVVPVKAGYPSALLVSLTQSKALANYHWPTDTAANVDYQTVADAARLTEAVARALAFPY
ncbi:MAG: M28 family peptidase [Candidatus Dormibacteraeota bacterium]|nr:M28 family peptidase [Candidatus Dormibacteraeota bacterium]